MLFLAHRAELVNQAAARAAQFGVRFGVIRAADKREDPDAPLQVASIQTLSRRDKPAADIVIIDEAHRAMGDSYQTLLEAYPDAIVIGLTATPIRVDGRGLGGTFTKLIEVATVSKLMDDGILVRPRIFAPPGPDLSGVQVARGDYDEAQLGAVMNDRRLVGDIVNHWKAISPGLRTVAFAVSVEHSLAIRDAFVRAGVPAAHLDGETPEPERTAILDDLAAGRVLVVSNCNVLGEGWDCPDVSVAILARPTMSTALYLQQVGRALRSSPGKNAAFVLDHANNYAIHGLPDEDRAWELTTARIKRPAVSLRSCPECYAVMPSGTVICTDCGFEWVPEPRDRDVETAAAGQLVELTRAPLPWANWPRWLPGALRPKDRKPTTEEKARLYRHLEAIVSRKGYAPGWAAHRYRELLGVWPRRVKEDAA